MNGGPEILIPISAIVGLFSSIILFTYLFFTTRHKQRIALLEHGKDAEVFKTIYAKSQNLKIGMAAIGIGFGVIGGYFLEGLGFPEAPAYVAMISILGGVALVIFYLIAKNEE